MSYIEFKNVCKDYKMGEVIIHALSNANLSIEKGELVVIVGPSGAGKTTALNILGGMDNATSGRVIVDNKDQRMQVVLRRCRPASVAGKRWSGITAGC